MNFSALLVHSDTHKRAAGLPGGFIVAIIFRSHHSLRAHEQKDR